MSDFKINKSDFDNIENYYSALHKQHGNSAQSCDYGSQLSQHKKFKVITESFNIKQGSLLDIGCGPGAYYEYLNSENLDYVYTGIDITESFITDAQKKYPQATFKKQNFLSEKITLKYDIVTANGIFYLLQNQPFEKLKVMVTEMFNICNSTLAFTSLSNWAKDQSPKEFYADPIDTLDFCRTLTPYVSLRHDYHDRDFLITMRKKQVNL